MSDPSNKSFHHGSSDPFEISYIIGGGNIDKFKDIGVRTERLSLTVIQFTSMTDKNIDFEKFNPIMTDILSRYRKNIRRSVYITSDEVAYFRGSESSHLKKIKESSMVEHVFFNNRESEDGTLMVEVAIVGNSLCVDRFMSELLKSVSSFKQKRLNYKPPPRPERPSKKQE